MANKGTRFILVLVLIGLCGLVTVLAVTRTSALSQQEETTTRRQREHSRLYEGRGNGRRLREHVTREGDVRIRRRVGLRGGDPNMTIPNLDEFLRGMACRASAVVVGVIQGGSAHLTEDGEYVYTDYELTIEEVFKDNADIHISHNTVITITYPGGVISVDGHTIEVIEDEFQPFTTGRRHLLFLEFIPATNTYRPLNSTSSFQLNGNRADKLTRGYLLVQGGLDNESPTSLLNRVRFVLSSNSN